MFKCPNCNKSFKSLAGKKSHMRRKNPCFKNISDKLPSESNETYSKKNTQHIAVNVDELILDQENKLEFPKLQTYDFSKINKGENYAISLIAIRRSGKTYLIKHLFPLLNKLYDEIFFISNSANNSCYDFVKKNKFEENRDEMIKDIFRYQRATKMANDVLLVFDDCISAKSKNNNALIQTFSRGRNRNIGCIFSSQYLKMISRVARNNSDLMIIGKNPGELEKFIVDNILYHKVKIPKHLSIKTKSQKLEYVTKFLQHFTKNHGFIIIDNVNQDIFYFKAP